MIIGIIRIVYFCLNVAILYCYLFLVFMFCRYTVLYYVFTGSYFPIEAIFNIAQMAFLEIIRAITKPEISHRIKLGDLKDVKDNIKICSHIVLRTEIVLNSYEHHLLISNVFHNAVEIIHFGPRSRKLKSLPGKCIIHKKKKKWNQIFNPKALESGIFLIKCNHYPKTDIENKAAIARAESRLGESHYHLKWNNCEHFVTWALTGIPTCKQWRNAGMLRRLKGDALDTVLCVYSSFHWFVYDILGNRSSKGTGSSLIIAICLNIITKIVIDLSLICFLSEMVYVPFVSVVMETVCLWKQLNDIKHSLENGTIHPLDIFREMIMVIAAPLASMFGSSISAYCLLPILSYQVVAALPGFVLAKFMHSFLIGLSAELHLHNT